MTQKRVFACLFILASVLSAGAHAGDNDQNNPSSNERIEELRTQVLQKESELRALEAQQRKVLDANERYNKNFSFIRLLLANARTHISNIDSSWEHGTMPEDLAKEFEVLNVKQTEFEKSLIEAEWEKTELGDAVDAVQMAKVAKLESDVRSFASVAGHVETQSRKSKGIRNIMNAFRQKVGLNSSNPETQALIDTQFLVLEKEYPDFKSLPAGQARKQIQKLSSELKLMHVLRERSTYLNDAKQLAYLDAQIQANSRKIILNLIRYQDFYETHPMREHHSQYYGYSANAAGDLIEFVQRGVLSAMVGGAVNAGVHIFYDASVSFWETVAIIAGVFTVQHYPTFKYAAIAIPQRMMHALKRYSCTLILKKSLELPAGK